MNMCRDYAYICLLLSVSRNVVILLPVVLLVSSDYKELIRKEALRKGDMARRLLLTMSLTST